jgi:hypothetical protein
LATITFNPNDEEALERIALWVIGASGECPTDVFVEERTLISFLQLHYLENRCLERLSTANGTVAGFKRVAWCSWRTLHKMQQVRARLRRRGEAFMRFAVELNSRLPTESPVVAFKGPSTYALTADPLDLRHSGDLDIIHPNPDKIYDMLIDMGYDGERYDVLRHEYGTASSEDLNVDVHKFLPIWRYPKTMDLNDPAWRKVPAVWRQPYQKRFLMKVTPAEYIGLIETGEIDRRVADNSTYYGRIQYHHLLKYSTCGKAPGTNHVRFPTPAFCVLIHAIHSFQDYTRPTTRDQNDAGIRPRFPASSRAHIPRQGWDHFIQSDGSVLEADHRRPVHGGDGPSPVE